MKCSKCGHDIQKDDLFCGACGMTLGGSAAADSGATSPERVVISFPQAIKMGFNNYFRFRGRSTRPEFWWWVLFVVLADIGLTLFDIAIGTYDNDDGLFASVFGLAVLIPGLALGARRLHDINRSGWWQLMWFGAPLVIPAVVLIVWATRDSDAGPNRYGPESR